MSNVYRPRLSVDGIYEKRYWYSDNIFAQYDYGLPNCTCYAWGRWFELLGSRPSGLSTGDGGNWYEYNINAGAYAYGSKPKLGAVACFASTVGGSGHVAIVEEIHHDGSFVTSNSGYYRPVSTYPPDTPNYFYLSNHNSTTKLASWMAGRYSFQGFIYIPLDFTAGLPLWLLFVLKRRRESKNGKYSIFL